MINHIESINIPYIDFDGFENIGVLEVNKAVKEDVIKIFNDIKKIGFPIDKMDPIDKYNFSDRESVINNNTSSYNFRFVGNTLNLSDHSLGLAIDINPLQNPWVSPLALNFSKYDPNKKGTIKKDSEIVKIFSNYGWSWGGNWKNPDYQHFFIVNKEIKNDLMNYLSTFR